MRNYILFDDVIFACFRYMSFISKQYSIVIDED